MPEHKMQTHHMQPLQLNTCPLTGQHLIEASAGTGKTFTLVYLYLRTLFERELLPEQVLVVTFTEAATRELTTRLREGLRELLGSNPSDLRTHLLTKLSPERLQAHGQRCEQHFDRARISTIHGFCQRSLKHHAFQSGQPFQQELSEDLSEQIVGCVADFWRKTFYVKPLGIKARRVLARLLDKGLDPRTLSSGKGLLPAFENPDLPLVPSPPEDADGSSLQEALDSLRTLYLTLREQWKHKNPMQILRQAVLEKHLNGTSYKLAFVDRWEQALDQWFGQFAEAEDIEAENIDPVTLWETAQGKDFQKALQQLSATQLASKTKKNKATPEHPFFEQIEALAERLQTYQGAEDGAYHQFMHDLVAHVRHTLPLLKARHRVMGFDDLLQQLAHSLDASSSESASTLAQALHKACPVAFIDEFQDTDRWQYTIFQTIYANGDIFFIGDPKQSIYSFRGADIDVYLEAREHVPPEHRWTLNTNYRSQPAYIQAMNTFYGLMPEPFGATGIAYQRVAPPSEKAQELTAPALYIWQVEEKFNAPRLRQTLAHAVAESVLRELQQPGITPADIAILVSTRKSFSDIARALQDKGIPVVMYQKHSVFSSPEAGDMVLFLEAVLDGQRQLSTALSAHSLGYTAREVNALREDEAGHVALIEACQQLKTRWHQQGVYAMWLGFVSHFSLYERVLDFRGGERSVTNFRHLAHLLQNEERDRRLSAEQTLAWLKKSIQQPRHHQENQMLQLESERAAVHLMTLHNSKGLEYKVVFCPTFWEESYIPNSLPLETRQMLELGSEDLKTHKADYALALQQEDLRLAYVGLTRARERCHVYDAGPATQKLSPLSHLLTPERLALLKAHNRVIQVAPLPETTAEQYVPPRPPVPELKGPHNPPSKYPDYFVTSFTRLAQQQDDSDTQQALIAPPEDAPPPEAYPLLVFPTGAESGIFFHAVLERLRLHQPIEKQSELLLLLLQQHGFDSHWKHVLVESLQPVLNTPFGHDFPALSDLNSDTCLKEWDFRLHLPHFRAQDVEAVLGLEELQDTQKPQKPGYTHYLTGSIDLVFLHEGRYYLADYKSNKLGDHPECYAPEHLGDVIQEHRYHWQYTLYTLALHRYLSASLHDYSYESHFGGCYYLFLRGMHPERPGHGVFFARPEAARIEHLCNTWGIL